MKRLKELKYFTLVMLLFTFVAAGSLSSCRETKKQENAKEQEEHPTEAKDSEEHPAKDSEEHPAKDSTEHPAKDSTEHPEG